MPNISASNAVSAPGSVKIGSCAVVSVGKLT
jgi:hypothetical protein